MARLPAGSCASQVFKKVILFSMATASASSWDVSANPAVPERLPASMGALGDSMTAGALAMFRRQDFVLPWTELMVALRALAYGLTSDLDKVESRKLSWASGYDTYRRVESHSYRLTQIAHLKKQIPTFNAAVSGAESRDVLNNQLDRMSAWSLKTVNKTYPDYVTLMIGPNDVCADSAAQMVDTPTYHANISRIVDDILVRSPGSKVVVGSLPNIEALRSVAKDARLYWGVSCEKLWQTVTLCPTLTTENDPYERARVAARVSDFNNALKDIVESRREEFGDRIRFAAKTYQIAFTANHLSIDCFHPNPEGQALLADATWEASWWTQEWKKKRAEIEAEEKRQKALRCKAAQRGGPGRGLPGC